MRTKCTWTQIWPKLYHFCKCDLTSLVVFCYCWHKCHWRARLRLGQWPRLLSWRLPQPSPATTAPSHISKKSVQIEQSPPLTLSVISRTQNHIQLSPPAVVCSTSTAFSGVAMPMVKALTPSTCRPMPLWSPSPILGSHLSQDHNRSETLSPLTLTSLTVTCGGGLTTLTRPPVEASSGPPTQLRQLGQLSQQLKTPATSASCSTSHLSPINSCNSWCQLFSQKSLQMRARQFRGKCATLLKQLTCWCAGLSLCSDKWQYQWLFLLRILAAFWASGVEVFGCIIVALSVVGGTACSGTAGNGSCAVTTSSPAGTRQLPQLPSCAAREAECSQKHLCHLVLTHGANPLLQIMHLRRI